MAWMRCLNASGVCSVEKRRLNSAVSASGMTLSAPVPALRLENCRLVGGKCSLPSSQVLGGDGGDGRCESVDRVVRQLRVGDVALLAVDAEHAVEAAAAAVLDDVAQALLAGGLAHQGVVDLLVAPLSASMTLRVPSTDGPSSSLVIRKAMEPLPCLGWTSRKPRWR
jgi:hypothetical protein